MSLDLIFGGEGPTKLGANWFGASSITTIGNLLCVEPIEFGSAVSEIELTVHYPQRPSFLRKRGWGSSPPAPPKTFRRFLRKKSKLEIRWVSQRRTSKNAFSFFKESQDPKVFAIDFDDVVDTLEYGTGTIKQGDVFDRDAFLTFIRQQRAMDRGSASDLQQAIENANRLSRARYDALDPWDKLDVDWDKMHPDARTILDDPQDWSNGHDFTPHGNDTGWDIFANWADYKNLTPKDAAQDIGWGDDLDFTQDGHWRDWVEINLALPFGHIKRSGTCPKTLAVAVLEVLRQDLAKAETQTGWEHQQDYLKSLTRYISILERYA